MKYRRFGRTEMMLSQFSLGCMQFTGDSPERNAIAVIERAVELGVNHLETARGYGNSEKRLGKALKRIFKRQPREASASQPKSDRHRTSMISSAISKLP
jgi:aryl-alcohol dehydrogenase-like predicted oxidoreductase